MGEFKGRFMNYGLGNGMCTLKCLSFEKIIEMHILRTDLTHK